MTESIFNLKTDVSELASANHGITRSQYNMIPPSRDVTGNNFPNGSIYFNWELNSTRWFLPQKSYLRLRCSITRGDLSQLRVIDGISPNMGLVANLFQNAEFRIGDKTVSRITDFVAQIDALEQRMGKSKSWMDSLGKSLNFWNSDFTERQMDVALDSSSSVPYENVSSYTQIGYSVGNTVAIAVTTGVLTFARAGAAPALPDARTVWLPGDEIVIDTGDAAVGTVRYYVSTAINATTLQLNNVSQVALAAGVYEFTRIRKTLSEDDSRQKLFFELCWQPPLSIFKIDHALPNGKYSLILNPATSSSYQKMAIESVLGGGDKAPGLTAATYKFAVVDMYMYLATVEGSRADNLTYLLDLSQTRVQTEKIDSTSFGQKNFDVSPSTHAITVAYQDLRAGQDSQISQSKLKSYTAAVDAETELNLERFYLNFAGQQFPSPDADPIHNTTIDYLTQRYLETQFASGAFFDTGGCESFAEWKKRGMYLTFNTPRDGTDKSTRVMISSQFRGGTDVVNMRILCFDHSKQVARVRIQDGSVVQVDLEDV